MKKLILLLIFMQLGVVSMAQDLYKNMNAPIHERIQDLLSKLTIEEKISLLRATSPGIERMGIDKYYMGNEALHGIIRPGKFTVFRRRSDLPVCGILSYIILLPVLFQMKPVPAGMNWNGERNKKTSSVTY